MLETIREFAREQLVHAGQEASARGRHSAYFVGVAEEWGEAASRGPHRTLWLDRLEEELANLREALRWTLQEQTDEDTRLRWATAMSPFWYMRDYYAEGYAWNVALGVAPGAARPTRSWARALVSTAILASNGQIDFAYAAACCEEALPIARAVGDTVSIIRALVNLGLSVAVRGDYERANAILEDAWLSVDRLVIAYAKRWRSAFLVGWRARALIGRPGGR